MGRISAFASLIFLLVPSFAHAQALESMGYFRTISERVDGKTKIVEPSGAILKDATVRIVQLPKREGYRTIYAAATLTLPASAAKIVFVFQRITEPVGQKCPAESSQILASPEELAQLKQPTQSQQVGTKVESWRRRIADIIGGTEAEVKGMKLKVVNAGPGERTYYDYRFIHCPGRVRVWLVDDQKVLWGPVTMNTGIALNLVK